MTDKLHILIAEDNPADVMMIEEALNEMEFNYQATVLSNGEKVIDYFKDSKNRLPDVVLLDLNMPRKSGHEVLSYMTEQESLRDIPVILTTVSVNENDVEKALSLKMNYYLHKPVNRGTLEPLLLAIKQLWKDNHLKLDATNFEGFSSKTTFIHYVLAGNPNTPEHILAELAKHPESKIRAHVACNSKTPLGTLKILIDDPNGSVRRSLAFNTNAPFSIFEQLANDHDLDVIMGVASSNDTPPKIRHILCSHENAYIAAKASETNREHEEKTN